jgi:hypothetical protein
LAGVIRIETSVAAVTVSVVEPETAPDAAVMVAAPAAIADADPLDPAALLIDAIAALEELQVADAVRSWVELSE